MSLKDEVQLIWSAYQMAQGSADHTQRECFVEVVVAYSQNKEDRIAALQQELAGAQMNARAWKQQAIGNQMCNMCNYLERDACLERFEALEKELADVTRLSPEQQ